MTTKSNNSTNGSGASKFRKDAAIFSPSNYVHPNYVPTSPATMNQMQPAMMGMPVGMNMGVNMGMNGNMMQNPMMTDYSMYNGYYSPYANKPNYEYNPYNPVPVSYIPPYPYMMNPMYMNMGVGAAGMGVNVPPDNKNKQRKYKKRDEEFQPGTKDEETSKESITDDAAGSEQRDNSVDGTEITEPETEPEVKKSEEVGEKSTESQTPTAPEKKEEVKEEVKETKEEAVDFISDKLPLYVNANADDFFSGADITSRNQQKSPLEKTLIIVQNTEKVVNYDQVEAAADQTKKNWASVVSSSVKKTKPKAAPADVATPKDVKNGTVPVKPVQQKDTIGTLSIKSMFGLLKDEEDQQYFKIYSRGLTNTGNICYMNSILQTILYCEPFNQLFKLIDLKTVGTLAESKTPLIDAIGSLYRDFSLQTNKSLSPENFYNKLNKLTKFSHLKWGQQEDAEEFLGYLLDGLHEEFIWAINEITSEQINSILDKVDENDNETKLQIRNAIKIVKRIHKNQNGAVDDEDDENKEDEWNEIGASKKVVNKRTVEIEPSPIRTIFGGQFRSVLQVSNKKEQSITLDPFQCIQLDIKDEVTTTIEEAFKKLNEPEQISFSSDSKVVNAKKQIFIDNLPEIMIIHLKRFSFENNNNIEKVRKKIQYNHKLTIPSELFSNWRKTINRDYQLIGVVYHHGMIAEGGHYTSDVLKQASVSETGGWIRIDDTSITKIEEEDVLNNDDEIKNAYILLYQRV